jgi:L-ascorbate metabolism protein UlaG (beta-lactamase superfamily)
MKVTKYEHACFTVEKDGKILVVDPGGLSPDFITPENVVGIVVTHEHPDHFDPDRLAQIFDKNPDSLLLADESITSKMVDHKSRSVKAGDVVEVGPFTLEFFGGKHAHIYQSTPDIANVGVLINNAIYYPGDSFALPNKPVDVLAVPLGAPWLKTSEAIDFLLAVKPRLAFPTHDALLSETGQRFSDSWLKQYSDTAGIIYQRLDSEAIEV